MIWAKFFSFKLLHLRHIRLFSSHDAMYEVQRCLMPVPSSTPNFHHQAWGQPKDVDHKQLDGDAMFLATLSLPNRPCVPSHRFVLRVKR